MNASNIITLLLVTFGSAAPQFMPFIPVEYQPIASGLVALMGSIYHLIQPSPSKGK